jgi:hypothetical protein
MVKVQEHLVEPHDLRLAWRDEAGERVGPPEHPPATDHVGELLCEVGNGGLDLLQQEEHHAEPRGGIGDPQRLAQSIRPRPIERPQHEDQVDVRRRTQCALGGAPEENDRMEIGAERPASGLDERVEDATLGLGPVLGRHFSRERGFRASFNASPIRLSARTMMKIVRPGKVAVHHAMRMNCSACISICPRETTLESPTPRKLSDASVMMAPAVRSEMVGMTTGNALGRM